jgi:ABC-type multidrug transport system fused ATPase/permease subunit
MKEMKWLLQHIRPYARSALGSLGMMIGAGIFSTVDPLLLRHLIDQSFPARHFAEAAIYGLMIALCFFARAALAGGGNLRGFRVTQAVGQDLRRELLLHMTRLSAEWHERTMLGDKISRLNTDVDQIAQFGSDAVNMVVRSSVFFILNLAVMLRLNARITLMLLPLLPVFYLVRRRFRSLIETQANATQERTGWAIGRIIEHLGGIIQLQLLGVGEARMEDSISSWSELVRVQWRQRSTEIVFSIAVSCVLALAIFTAIEFGIYEFAAGVLSVGTIFAFYTYTTRIFEPVSSAMELYARSQSMLASARRVLDVTNQRPAVPDSGCLSIMASRLYYGLRMENVSFRYAGDRWVLRDIDLQIRPGEATAIVGLSGSGKSSLARLFVRLADPCSGSVFVDQRTATDYTLAALRATIAYVPQTPVLFQGTIRENLICMNHEASQHELDAIVAATELGPVLERLELGLDHPLQAAAAGLSGGEQQRLAIARALVRKSAVLILDESTSAMDAPTEAAVLRAIRCLRPEMTLIVISHRVKALSWVDRFFVLEGGRITAQGNHQQLFAESGHYRVLLHCDGVDAGLTFLDRVTSFLDRFEADGILGNGHSAHGNIERGAPPLRRSHGFSS